jgi:hypothetical protein
VVGPVVGKALFRTTKDPVYWNGKLTAKLESLGVEIVASTKLALLAAGAAIVSALRPVFTASSLSTNLTTPEALPKVTV